MEKDFITNINGASNKDLNEIKKRLLKLESARQSKIQFFFQYLLAPILVLGLGFFFNMHLEEKRSEVQQLELAHIMLPELFSEDTYIALASQKLLASVLQDEKLKQEIQEIIQKHMQEKLRELSINHNERESDKLIKAATSVQSPITDELIKYQSALRSERQGFQYLIDANYEKAIIAFEEAENIYPKFHQVYEIANHLKSNQSLFDAPNTRSQIIKPITEEMAWKAPKDLMDALQ